MGARAAMLFLTVLIGFAALYLATRNRWDWTKLMRRLVLALVLLLGGFAGGVYWNSLPPTSPVSEFWDVSLGASKSDVRFLKGEPLEVVEPGTWVYKAGREGRYHVVFEDTDQVVRVVAMSASGLGSGAFLFGVREGFDAGRLVDRVGDPSRVIHLSNDLRRAYLYPHLNAVFILERGRVVSYGIYDVDAGDPYAEGEDEAGVVAEQ